jgi:hypothetical protein
VNLFGIYILEYYYDTWTHEHKKTATFIFFKLQRVQTKKPWCITPAILEAPPLAYFDMMIKFLFLRRKKIDLKIFSLASLQQQHL